MSSTTHARWRAAAVAIPPAVMLAGFAYHPWIGNPGDAGFLAALAAAVVGDTTRWALSHLAVAVGSGLLILSFLAIRSFLGELDEGRWSALGLPFVVMGSTLFALLPALEFAPLAAAVAGVDVQAVQAALEPWFRPIHLASAALFLVGTLGFAVGIARSAVLGPRLTWLVVGALTVMAATRFLPLSVALLYVGPTAGIVALWPLAVAIWRHPGAQSPAHRQAMPERPPPATSTVSSP